ncbi:MAG: beta-galactosidase, partial [Chloroflexi bacterium]|nr:beta-galactosidase [Chloroflexota bacterium]
MKRFLRYSWLVILSGLIACTPVQAIVTPTTTPAPTATAWPRARLKSPEYGIQAFLWWKPEIAKRDLTLIQQLGFTWVKQNFAWRDIENQQKGHFEWELADNIVRRVGKRGD